MTDIIQEIENIPKEIVDFFKTNPTGEAIVADVKALFAEGEALVERNGGSLLVTAATTVLPTLLAGQWGVAVSSILSLAKAAGASTIAAEEQLAASTALQIAQAAGNALNPTAAVASPVPATEAPVEPTTEAPAPDAATS